MQSLPLAPQLAVTKPHSPRCKGHHDSPIPALPECLLGPQPVQKMSGRQRGEHGPVSEGTFGVFGSLQRLGCGTSRALAWQHTGEVLPTWFPGLYLSLTTPAGNCLDPPQLHSLCPPRACRVVSRAAMQAGLLTPCSEELRLRFRIFSRADCGMQTGLDPGSLSTAFLTFHQNSHTRV